MTRPAETARRDHGVDDSPLVASAVPGPPERAITTDGRARARRVGGVVVLAVVALALRLEGIGTWYWIDEALSVGIARHDLVDIPNLLLRDGSPPLWYLGLHVWTDVFGETIVATHAFSFIFGALMAPAAWLVGRRTFGERAGWCAGALAAISPFVTYFSRETRMYSLVALLSVVVAGSFVAAFLDRRDAARWWFAGSLTALVYTHNWGLYTALACVVALAAVLATSPAAERGAALRRAVAPFAVVGIAYLPWAPALLSQVENTGAPWSYTPTARDVVRELAALFRDERVLVGLGLAALMGLLPLARRPLHRDAVAAVVLGILVVVPVVLGWALAHVEPSWATRYLAVIVGPLLLLVAVGVARAGTLGVIALALAAVLILQPLSRLNGYPVPLAAKSNGRAIAAQMSPRLAEGDLVVVVQPEAVPLLRHELGGSFVYADPTGAVDDPTVMDWRDALERVEDATYENGVGPLVGALRPGQRVLIVLPGNASAPTDTDWITAFRAAGRTIQRALRADERFELVDRRRGPGFPYVSLDAALYERVN